LYINIARTLWGYNISKKKGNDGKLIEPDTSMVPGFFSVPKPFDCDITVRSAKHAKLIKQTWASAEEKGVEG
jgi:hypothetical protein